MQSLKIVLYLYLYINICNTATHASHRNPVKCSKSRLVTTSAPKHFIPKVAYFYPKSGVVLGASIYVKPPPTAILRLAKRLRRLPEQARLPVPFLPDGSIVSSYGCKGRKLSGTGIHRHTRVPFRFVMRQVDNVVVVSHKS